MNNGVKSRILQVNYNEGVYFCQQVEKNIHGVNKPTLWPFLSVCHYF